MKKLILISILLLTLASCSTGTDLLTDEEKRDFITMNSIFGDFVFLLRKNGKIYEVEVKRNKIKVKEVYEQ